MQLFPLSVLVLVLLLHLLSEIPLFRCSIYGTMEILSKAFKRDLSPLSLVRGVSTRHKNVNLESLIFYKRFFETASYMVQRIFHFIGEKRLRKKRLEKYFRPRWLNLDSFCRFILFVI